MSDSRIGEYRLRRRHAGVGQVRRPDAADLAVADAFGVADRLRPVFRQRWTVDVSS
ncbi:hypothetical protein GCM10022243_53870 [Saccharothrix violaceirubra]|uniref:Uncharacterized protein n=1 Tax=Saccharothrix violaceirubra TaxID=413306 RepID=A0A7W7T1A3_9PSEU|nr:hypothetical protein [Saccharothrix violaceirubra]MBB4963450.1 hypothetical protein [Saccharothrix violaceirubra]